ncbi:MAG: InlB B-repeat-containing protein, partial [Firmicutes bacterium]|nr:InlB B-repeat-containing protein [Bacillota bacterium]
PVGSGTAVFESDTNTLTLTNANITKGYKYVGENYEQMIGIYSDGIDLAVVLEGKNTVKGNDLDDGIVAGDGTLAIKAEDGGSLLVDVKDDCLATPEKVTIESGDITLKGFYGIITAGTIEIKDGKVEVIAGDGGLDGHAGVNISGGEVSVSSNGGFAIYTNEAINLSGSDTIIKASGVTNAIFAVKNINIEEPLAITDPEDGRLGSNSNGKFIVYPNNAYVTRVVIAKPYTITVDENITNGAVTTEPVEKAAKGMEVSVTAEPDSGYKLDKITVTDSEGNEIPVKGGKFTMPADNVTVSAMFKKSGGGGGGGSGIVSFILTYETNGGEKIKAESHKVGDEVTLDKTPVKDGYTFTGWYADKECTQKIESITMNSSKTVYAGWDDGTQPVNHDENAPLMTIKIGDTKYQLNGVDMEMDAAPFIDENDRTMLPVRVVANALGISDDDIAWDNETKTASFTRPDGKVVSCTVGEKAVKIGDDIVEIDTAPVIAGDRIFLPMRALFNAFNVSDEHIIWDGETKTVTVTKEALDDINSL